jgi:predicted transglutaminase-like cysteine proteinase
MRYVSILWLCLSVVVLEACQTLPSPPLSQAMTAGSDTPAPFGFVAFCERHQDDCLGQSKSYEVMPLTGKRWDQLQRINWQINTQIEPLSDVDHYQTVEYWTYPETAGDCEDYALAKRKLLMAKGWPAHSLLLSVAIEAKGTAHAVLIAVTDNGDFVLDNQVLDILPWQNTPYVWDKRQSTTDPMRWVKLRNEQQIAALSSASIRP